MKKNFLAILAIAIVAVVAVPMGGYAKINYGGEYVFASNGNGKAVEKSVAPAPSAIKSNGECKPTVVPSAISKEELSQLARELRRENEKRAATLNEEFYGRKGSAKKPTGGVIGGIINGMVAVRESLKKIEEKVKSGEEKTAALEEAVSDLDERLVVVEKTINGDGKKVKGLKKEVREARDKAIDAQKVAYEVYNYFIAMLFVMGVMVVVAIAAFFLRKRKTSPAGNSAS